MCVHTRARIHAYTRSKRGVIDRGKRDDGVGISEEKREMDVETE